MQLDHAMHTTPCHTTPHHPTPRHATFLTPSSSPPHPPLPLPSLPSLPPPPPPPPPHFHFFPLFPSPYTNDPHSANNTSPPPPLHHPTKPSTHPSFFLQICPIVFSQKRFCPFHVYPSPQSQS